MTPVKKLVFVVIPNWNGAEFLDECLVSVTKQSLKCRIVVVDNASTDNSVEIVRAHPDIDLVELSENHGFAGGVNAGIGFALGQGAEYIALFNNDAVADSDWLKSLVDAASKDRKIGIVTSKLLHFDGKKIDSTGDFYSSWGFPFPRGRDENESGQYDAQREIFSGSGGASLYRAEMIKEIGLFDEDFFAYFEDVDLGFRAQLAGWKAVYEPSAKAFHRIGGTSSKINHFARYQTIKNFIYLYTKNMPGWLYWKYLPKFWIGLMLMVANDIKKGRFHLVASSYLEAARKLPKMLVKRYRIQRKRKVSNQYINSILYHRLPPTQKTLLSLRAKFSKS